MTSTKSRSNTWSYFRFRTGQNRVMWILLTVLNLMGFPLMFTAANLLYNTKSEEFNELMSAIALISALSIFIAVVISLFVVYNAFDYLSKKVLTDMAYSTPVTNNKRFLADWFSGLFTAVSPFVIGILLGYVPMFLLKARFGVIEDFNITVSVYSQFALAMIIGLIMAYCFGAFVTMCCGAKLEAIGYTVLLHGLVPISIFITLYSAFRYFTLGSLVPVDDICLKWIAPTSPIGMVINLFAGTIESNYYYDGITQTLNKLGYVHIFSFRFILISLLIIAVLFALTMFLNTKRKAEKCGNPFVFKGLYYFCLSVYVFCAVMICVSTKNIVTSVALIVMTCIIYMLFEVLKNRGFKGIWKGALRLVVSLALSCVLALGVIALGTSINSKVPKVEDVKSVVMEYKLPNSEVNLNLEITDKDLISKIVSVYKGKVDEIYDENKNGGSYYVYGYTTTPSKITYKFNNGTKMNREMQLGVNELLMLRDIAKTDAYKQAYINKVKSYYGIGGTMFFNGYYSGKALSTKIATNEFLDAYIKDLESFNNNEFVMPSVKPLCRFAVEKPYLYGIGIDEFLPINENFKNTISLIKEKGYYPDFEEISENNPDDYILKSTEIFVLSSEIKDCEVVYNYDEFGNDYKYTTSYNMGDFGLITYIAGWNFYHPEYEPYHNDKEIISKVEYSDKVKELLKVAVPCGISEEPLYSIVVDNKNYLIPKEYNSLAKEVMQSGKSVSDWLESESVTDEYIEE